ncbi:MAG: response regulator transcription factor [Bacteroidota bacterium]
MRVLIVEDNPSLLENTCQFLIREGHTCYEATNVLEASDALISQPVDMVILDIMLPDGEGFEVLSCIQDLELDPGVLIVSARNALDDKLKGLDLGADDYLTKPFHLSELHARIQAIYRRKSPQGGKDIVFNELLIQPENMEVCVHDKPVSLTPKEFELLLYFWMNKNRVLTKASIAEHLWGDQLDLYNSFDFVYQHIKNIRKKLTKAGSKDYISTVYGFGYKFNTRLE